jgi:hypothetical protein
MVPACADYCRLSKENGDYIVPQLPYLMAAFVAQCHHERMPVWDATQQARLVTAPAVPQLEPEKMCAHWSWSLSAPIVPDPPIRIGIGSQQTRISVEAYFR